MISLWSDSPDHFPRQFAEGDIRVVLQLKVVSTHRVRLPGARRVLLHAEEGRLVVGLALLGHEERALVDQTRVARVARVQRLGQDGGETGGDDERAIGGIVQIGTERPLLIYLVRTNRTCIVCPHFNSM